MVLWNLEWMLLKKKKKDDITRLVTPCMIKAARQLLNLCRLSCSSLPPPRPSESLTPGLFIDLPDGGLARCMREAGAVGMSWCSLSSAARWTHGGPSHINQFCRSSHMSKQHDNPPGSYLPPPGRAVNKGSRICCCGHEHVQLFARIDDA